MSSKENFKDKEIALIKGCLKGDRKSQRGLYDQFSGKFLSICLRYIKDPDLAQDVLVEGFMKIFQSLNTYRHEGSFEGWMKRIMVTQALLTLRKNKKLLMEVDWEGQDPIVSPNLIFWQYRSSGVVKTSSFPSCWL
ncbi:RNA polymerase ECF-type sigma factor [Cyclobacterium qasimii M12-11B]|uniref:RNA polymerase ECF-type sigma factor n=1 Tax=Cyclobacterium qasimii M12-11B TaxID=641524 RepID=S7VD62_9BACT|nr:sigma-70 family RNA polymerase sigma factor [Cyclobacterium qasimii]EPR67507.1 RNA polymerase ECF-type sigma factor [Cyclobacterium qasimii M12-11B]